MPFQVRLSDFAGALEALCACATLTPAIEANRRQAPPRRAAPRRRALDALTSVGRARRKRSGLIDIIFGFPVIYGEKHLAPGRRSFIRKRCVNATPRAPLGARTLWFTQMTIEKLSCDSFMTAKESGRHRGSGNVLSING